MSQTKNRGIDWVSLLIGILFILTSLLSFQNPAGDLVGLVLVFASLAIVKGIYELYARYSIKKISGKKSYLLVVLGILDILIGVYLLFNLDVGLVALPIVFAIWFLIDSILNLFTLDFARAISTGYFWFTLIINILGIIVGIMLLFDPLTSALTLSFLVGVYFMMAGIISLIYAFR
ncbi:hypothetical protein D929_01898 [Enterococcus faecalis 02-MB-P-10]|uniref:HdeD family acid-resistance protein n=1 Tax=Enterococcus faecalis TaxID=1351 RepID=UPI00035353BF|nr:DUF308 domain-containing protein [Enterococcus faecalis]EPH72678.1 hypothetical protein D929_01898 [Enterococcus faecalis 02-MB-P-10]